MRIRTFVAASILATGVALPTAAFAQTADDPYTRPPAEVLSEDLQRPAEVLPASAVRAETQSQSLPVTGTDIAGLTIVGLAAIAGGTVLARRSRPRAEPQTA